jgi:hypothetical protein
MQAPTPPEPSVDLSNRLSIIAWLEWSDRNGDYSHKDLMGIGWKPMTLELLREQYKAANNDGGGSDPTTTPGHPLPKPLSFRR